MANFIIITAILIIIGVYTLNIYYNIYIFFIILNPSVPWVGMMSFPEVCTLILEIFLFLYLLSAKVRSFFSVFCPFFLVRVCVSGVLFYFHSFFLGHCVTLSSLNFTLLFILCTLYFCWARATKRKLGNLNEQ